MPNPKLAARYAKAILDLSAEQGQTESVKKDMQYIGSTIKESREFELFLQSPVIKGDKKKSILNEILGDKVSPLVMSFIHLMVSKGREAYLPEIATAFHNQYNQLNNIKEVKVTTAVPMTDDVRKKVTEKILSLTPGQTVQTKESINPDIIGGFIIEIDDKLYDASVSKELQEIRKQFSRNIYVPSL